MDTDKRNKNRTNSKPPTLPTVQEEKSAPLDAMSKVSFVAQTVGDCIDFQRDYGCDEKHLAHVATMFRAVHRWHIERAKGLASGVAA